MKRGRGGALPATDPAAGPSAAPDGAEAQSLLLTIKATGGSVADGVKTLRDSGMDPCAVPALLEWARQEFRKTAKQNVQTGAFYSLLWGLLEVDADFSNAAFRACKRLIFPGRLELSGCDGLKVLPEHLETEDELDLSNLNSLETIGNGLKVGRFLDLAGCGSLRSLPAGLQIEDYIWLKGCQKWDGIIPADAVIGGTIITDFHPLLDLDAWRKKFGTGSCFKGRGVQA